MISKRKVKHEYIILVYNTNYTSTKYVYIQPFEGMNAAGALTLSIEVAYIFKEEEIQDALKIIKSIYLDSYVAILDVRSLKHVNDL